MRKTNDAGLELIRTSEGLRLNAYRCPAGVWTIGYGHTGDVKKGDRITEHQANVVLNLDLEHSEGRVAYWVKAPITDNQFAALVSFTFNLGEGALARSSLLKKVNAGADTAAAAEFLKWVYATGRVLPGLVRRRAAERRLFLAP